MRTLPMIRIVFTALVVTLAVAARAETRAGEEDHGAERSGAKAAPGGKGIYRSRTPEIRPNGRSRPGGTTVSGRTSGAHRTAEILSTGISETGRRR